MEVDIDQECNSSYPLPEEGHMMRYRYRGGRRGRWGIGGFPWVLFFFFMFFNHSWSGFWIGIVITILLFLLMRAIISAASSTSSMNANTMANQSPQPHEEGYQRQPEAYQEGGQSNQYPQPQYEQPQVPYPQELPPMEQ